jgi:hypothetical protein
VNIFCFNTGRLYTEAGQRIAGAVLDNGAIAFLDFDRQVDGYIPPGFYPDEHPKRRVELAYMEGGWTYHEWPLDFDWSERTRLLHSLRNLALEAPSLQRYR